MNDPVNLIQKEWNHLSDTWGTISKQWRDEQHSFLEKKFWQPLTIESKEIIKVSARLVEVMESAKRNVK